MTLESPTFSFPAMSGNIKNNKCKHKQEAKSSNTRHVRVTTSTNFLLSSSWIETREAKRSITLRFKTTSNALKSSGQRHPKDQTWESWRKRILVHITHDNGLLHFTSRSSSLPRRLADPWTRTRLVRKDVQFFPHDASCQKTRPTSQLYVYGAWLGNAFAANVLSRKGIQRQCHGELAGENGAPDNRTVFGKKK